MRTKFFYLLALISLLACKKPSERNCWKGAGEPTIDKIELDPFNAITIGSKLEVTLVQDSLNYIEIIGFQNLNSKVKIEIKDHDLTLENTNKCDFLRNYDYKSLKVRVHFTELHSITYNGTAPIYTEGIITGNTLDVESLDGASTINLNINVNTFNANQGGGFSDFNITGRCNYAHVKLANNGYCDMLGLVVREQFILINNSQADGKVNINGTTNVLLQTTHAGDILYTGTPVNLNISELAKGKVYRIN